MLYFSSIVSHINNLKFYVLLIFYQILWVFSIYFIFIFLYLYSSLYLSWSDLVFSLARMPIAQRVVFCQSFILYRQSLVSLISTKLLFKNEKTNIDMNTTTCEIVKVPLSKATFSEKRNTTLCAIYCKSVIVPYAILYSSALISQVLLVLYSSTKLISD